MATRTLACLCLLVTQAAAEPRVVIVETPAVGLATLGAQVQLHGGRAIEIETVAEQPGIAIAGRARELVATRDATLVVWVETVETAPPDAPQQRAYVVYVAGPWADRALIELVRVDASVPESELSRTIALKIVGLLDTALAPKPLGTALGVPARELRADGWRVAVGADVIASGDRSPAAGPSLTVEHRANVLALQVAGVLTLRTLLAGSIEQGNATVSIDDAGAVLAVEAGFAHWFARAGGGVTVLHATATTSDGDRGSATVTVPTAELGVGARLRLSSTELALLVGVDHAVIRQRFLVDDMVITDLGRIRAFGRVYISVPLP